jgi:hypothetical protein
VNSDNGARVVFTVYLVLVVGSLIGIIVIGLGG